MRCFKNIAELIKTRRLQHPKAYSQSELSHLLGYKNGQFISNVERALCNIPLKMLGKVTEVLDITPEALKEAILRDHEETLNNYLRTQEAANVSTLRPNETSVDSSTTSAFSTSGSFKMSSNS
jgi:hypothetical protein